MSGIRFSCLILFIVSIALVACEEPINLPKKHGFPRMNIPDSTAHQVYESQTCPFTFKAPAGGEISRDLADSCWLDLKFPAYDLVWHISHREVNQADVTAEFYFEEHRRLVYKHSQKASEIRPLEFEVPAGRVIAHELYGEVGTPYYVFLRDPSNSQVVTMSFYFQTSLENDSLAPLITYMKQEMDNALLSFEFAGENSK
ncbi:MAG: hypothetical protein AB8F95_06950 [Bacteroidia bacterium]